MKCLGVNVALQSHSNYAIELDIYVINAPVLRVQTENYNEVNLHIDLYQSHRDPQSPALAQFGNLCRCMIGASTVRLIRMLPKLLLVF